MTRLCRSDTVPIQGLKFWLGVGPLANPANVRNG